MGWLLDKIDFWRKHDEKDVRGLDVVCCKVRRCHQPLLIQPCCSAKCCCGCQMPPVVVGFIAIIAIFNVIILGAWIENEKLVTWLDDYENAKCFVDNIGNEGEPFFETIRDMAGSLDTVLQAFLMILLLNIISI